MSMTRVASQYTYKNLVTNDMSLTVAGGEPVHVYGICLTPAPADTTFTIYEGDGSTVIEVVILPGSGDDGGGSIEKSIPFIADKGLVVTTSLTASHVTVFHSAPGI